MPAPLAKNICRKQSAFFKIKNKYRALLKTKSLRQSKF